MKVALHLASQAHQLAIRDYCRMHNADPKHEIRNKLVFTPSELAQVWYWMYLFERDILYYAYFIIQVSFGRTEIRCNTK